MYRIIDLFAGIGGMSREKNLIIDTRLTDFSYKGRRKTELNKNYIRNFTPRECARLQGFPDDFKFVVSDTQLFKQFGNSVSVPVIKAIAENIRKTLNENI